MGLPLTPAQESEVLAQAASILRRRTTPGRERQFHQARLLLLAVAMKLRTSADKTTKGT